MDRGIRAQLSPNESGTLSRIAADMVPRAMLSARDVAQLLKLQLVREVQGKLELTAIGRERYRQIRRRDRPRRSIREDQRGALSPPLQTSVARPGGARRGEYPIARSYSASGIP
jgi:hypothetical protein